MSEQTPKPGTQPGPDTDQAGSEPLHAPAAGSTDGEYVFGKLTHATDHDAPEENETDRLTDKDIARDIPNLPI